MAIQHLCVASGYSYRNVELRAKIRNSCMQYDTHLPDVPGYGIIQHQYKKVPSSIW